MFNVEHYLAFMSGSGTNNIIDYNLRNSKFCVTVHEFGIEKIEKNFHFLLLYLSTKMRFISRFERIILN